MDGVCQPYALTTVLGVTGAATDSDSVFFSTRDLVVELDTQPLMGGVEVLHSSGFVAPQTYSDVADAGAYVVAAGRDVSSTELGPVHRLSKDGASVVNLAFPAATTSASAGRVMSNATRAVWQMSEFESGVGFHFSLVGRTLAGGPGVIYYDGSEYILGAGLTASEVLWLQGDDELWRAPVGGGAAEQFGVLPDCSDLAVGNSAIYALCAEGNSEVLFEVGFDGSIVEELFSYETPYWQGATRLHLSAGRLIWIDENSGSGDSFVWKWELEPGIATSLVSTTDVGGLFRALATNDDSTFLAVGGLDEENVIWVVAE